ncbi:hypothetical protein HY634_01035 [Candidatus Uhrbacteria bacterium]|nr:hypothetical protein [Candidatus Uhrbacteria bacterium]
MRLTTLSRRTNAPSRRRPPTPKDAPRSALPTRYHGLTAKQIRALIEIDELATHHDGMADVMRRYRDELGREITVADMRVYAQEAETRGHNGTACAWYEATIPLVTAAEDRRAFRAFLLRVGWIEVAEKHGYKLTPDELRPVAHQRLREANHSAYDGRLPGALKLFEQIGDRNGIRRVLARAVALGRHDIAVRAARALDSPLRRNELLRIARCMFAADSMYYRDAAAYIAEHSLRELYHPLIEKMAASKYVGFARLRTWARRLDIPLTQNLIERYHHMQKEYGLGVRDIVASAHALARQSPAWRRRLPSLYRWCRSWGMGYSDPEVAEQYGQKCGQPLTIAELQKMAEYHAQSDIEYLDWARKRRKFCLDLAARRIAEATSAPPNPVTPLRRKSARSRREPIAAAA